MEIDIHYLNDRLMLVDFVYVNGLYHQVIMLALDEPITMTLISVALQFCRTNFLQNIACSVSLIHGVQSINPL